MGGDCFQSGLVVISSFGGLLDYSCQVFHNEKLIPGTLLVVGEWNTKCTIVIRPLQESNPGVHRSWTKWTSSRERESKDIYALLCQSTPAVTNCDLAETPDFLLKANRVPPNKRGAMLSGQVPANKMLTRAVNDERRTDLTSLRTSKCWGVSRWVPSADPAWKEKIARITSPSVVWKASEFDGRCFLPKWVMSDLIIMLTSKLATTGLAPLGMCLIRLPFWEGWGCLEIG